MMMVQIETSNFSLCPNTKSYVSCVGLYCDEQSRVQKQKIDYYAYLWLCEQWPLQNSQCIS